MPGERLDPATNAPLTPYGEALEDLDEMTAECVNLKRQLAEARRLLEATKTLRTDAETEADDLRRQLVKAQEEREAALTLADDWMGRAEAAEEWMNRQTERARAPLLPGGWGPGQIVSAAASEHAARDERWRVALEWIAGCQVTPTSGLTLALDMVDRARAAIAPKEAGR
jgi:chromosome segregation ATPase